jgi:dienelactone hydrolase
MATMSFLGLPVRRDRRVEVTLLLSSAMRLARRLTVFFGVPIAVLIGGYAAFHEYVRAATFVVHAAGMQGVVVSVADLETRPITERDVRIPWRGGELPARWYAVASPARTPILLVPGVHAAGIDEPRLVGVARDLASVGHPVLTTELADLKQYAITPRSTDMIEDAAQWLASQQDLAPDGRVGMIGISFAGGLSIVAAGRPSVRDRVEFVMSFGGHGDLPRTLHYLCTGQQPDGTARPPHDYGVAIILLGVADRVVPSEQVEPLRSAILTFLEASRLDMVDKKRSEAEFARARELAAGLPEPARTLMGYVNDRDVSHLGPVLLPHVTALGGDPALSPSRSTAPSADVYLLHGADDNVIPAVESVLLARELRGRGVHVEHLVTPLITHAEVDRPPTIGEVWTLVRFWGKLLDE